MMCPPRSWADRVLHGGSNPVDTVSVEEARDSGSNISTGFTVRFSITRIQASQDRVHSTWYVFPHELCGSRYILNIPLVFLFVRAQGECGTSRFPSQTQMLVRRFVRVVLGSASSR